MLNLIRHRTHSAGLALLPCLLLAFWATFVAAAELDTPTAKGDASSTSASAPVSPGADKPKQCYNGCLSWGQACNVDPRGVYKCQRRCEKFGEICE